MTASLLGTIMPKFNESHFQDLQGRLWDMLTMFRHAAKRSAGESLMLFDFLIQKEGKQELVKVKAVCGPGDEGEPVITVMLPEED